jgi:glutamate--cysteine ligase
LLEPTLRWLEQPGNASLVRRGLRGVEKETLRVSGDGQLSGAPHPRAFGSALTHPYVTTDYSEALVEFVTPPHATNWQTLQFLCDLHAFTHRRLDGELFWPLSMPCVINANDSVPIAQYGSSNEGRFRTVYRSGLGLRYGRAMQAIAGAHFNYSMPADFWPAYREHTAGGSDLRAFKSDKFMGLIRNYRRNAWIVLYLFGASSAMCKSFRPAGHVLLEELDPATWYAPFATSLRMSDIGYRNSTQARLDISVNSLADYLAGLSAALTTPDPAYEAMGIEVDGEHRQLNANVLQIENEYYSAIRPKPADRQRRTAAALARDGIEYVEVRTLDLNPADPVGLNQEQMRFLETLLVYCLLERSPPISAAEQDEIERRDLAVAREGRRPGLEIERSGRPVSLESAGRELLEAMRPVAALLDEGPGDYPAAIEAAAHALGSPESTPSARLLAALKAEHMAFFEYGLALARRQHEYFLAMPLDGEIERRLADAAAESLARTAELEAAPAPSFGEYLRAYFAETRN